ncbi:peroxisome assembly factor 2-like, partial [Fopius arisanus]|uniref:Peroxisome assembly factor 2-like n=1 Tax=Fopius arisanus TaxID=64838 RepID=A0A9R1T041_9HYME
MMTSSFDFVQLLRQSTRGLMRNNYYYVLAIVFVHYAGLRLRKLKNNRVEIRVLPDDVFRKIVGGFSVGSEGYVDGTCCVMGSGRFLGEWVNICCEESPKKYRTRFLNIQRDERVVYLSETLLFNVENLLGCQDPSKYFFLPASNESLHFADEVRISMISNPHECSTDLIDGVLKNFFSNPKYLRKNDVITADIREFNPNLYYSLPAPQLKLLHFRVNSITIDKKRTSKPVYVFQKVSTLIQEKEIHKNLPRSLKVSINGNNDLNIKGELQGGSDNCPEFFKKYLQELESCILPFISSDNWLGLKPVFLVEGPQGCGKYHLVKILSQRLGLNFMNVDCSEIQTLSPSQTEAKIRIAFNNAEKSTPCILKLSNIQILGKNAEGKIDERVTSNFSHQLTELYSTQSSHPLIIIATSESSELPSDFNRIFIEKIKIKYLSQNERTDLITWFLQIQNIKHSNVDISKISAMCSDFVMKDLQSLSQIAVKNRYKKTRNRKVLRLQESDLTDSYKSMQSIFSDKIGAPKIPEVHWEDIGGLASLKHEIIRRIELPLMQNSGIQSSGILLYGPPGTGKTLLAKAVAT